LLCNFSTNGSRLFVLFRSIKSYKDWPKDRKFTNGTQMARLCGPFVHRKDRPQPVLKKQHKPWESKPRCLKTILNSAMRCFKIHMAEQATYTTQH
jgi:hypothetical protein